MPGLWAGLGLEQGCEDVLWLLGIRDGQLGDDPTRSLRDLYRTRKSLYEAVASFVIDVDELTPDEIVTRILDETGVKGDGR